MVADKYERYEVSPAADGLNIFAWQLLPRVGGGVIALVLLLACFATDPYEGHGRIWTGLGIVTLALVAAFGVRLENWVITEGEVRYKSSLWSNELTFERSPESPFILRVEHLPGDAEGTRPPFPHVVHLIAPGGIEIGDGFRFRVRSNLDHFVETLRTVSPIDVADLESEKHWT